MILDILTLENSLMLQEPEKYPDEKRLEANKWDSSTEIQISNTMTYTRKLMCLTLSGLPVPIITITASKGLGKKSSRREAIVISSRVHPGETNSSFVFAGVIEMLCKPRDPIT